MKNNKKNYETKLNLIILKKTKKYILSCKILISKHPYPNLNLNR